MVAHYNATCYQHHRHKQRIEKMKIEAKIGDTGTLKQLGVQAGDVVEFVKASSAFKRYTSKYAGTQSTVDHSGGTYKHADGSQGWMHSCGHVFKLISRGTPKTFDDMTDAEQGVLLLAKHRGEELQALAVDHDGSTWVNQFGVIRGNVAYRVKPESVVEECVEFLTLDADGIFDTHKLTYNRVDGEIDCASAVLVKL